MMLLILKLHSVRIIRDKNQYEIERIYYMAYNKCDSDPCNNLDDSKRTSSEAITQVELLVKLDEILATM